ncbi:fasciclin-like arabinogalactan protein 21 [Malania oleifera]|uniref:fasciclin-like arabinogalactan protein 21 n=1 Tax=Malania oleifera TaxID=397392 RepID=UPI0025AEAA05|nr:fasciclin-like arabinogalactan protein 21 [Malania oleifera]
MATPLQAAIIATIMIIFISKSTVSAIEDQFEASTTSSSISTSPPPPPPPLFPPLSQPYRSDPFTASSFLAPILLSLGFQELAMAVHSLPSPPAWTGPSTIFAPTDASIHSCSSCSVPRLLQEHIIPGLFTLNYLRTLPFGTKIETMVPGRCVTVTSAVNNTKLFMGGVEITHPDLFNNGFLVVHGLDGFVSHLSPFSCNIERVNSLYFPTYQPADRSQPLPSISVMRLMLRDAMLRLRISGYSILALALRVKYAELVGLHNMTVFALDDISIFNGGHAYVREVRFHIVPNRLLMAADLEHLPPSTVLPTLEPSEALVVTTAGLGGGGGGPTPLRINYVRMRSPDLLHNLRIVVHGLFMPFPHLNPTVDSLGDNGRTGLDAAGNGGSCRASEMEGACAMGPSQEIKWTADNDDHRGL